MGSKSMVIGIMAARNFAHLKKKIIGKLEKMININRCSLSY